MTSEKFEIELPEPIALEGIILWAREKPYIFLKERKENGINLISPDYKTKATDIILNTLERGDFVFYGILPPDIEGHRIYFYSMNNITESVREVIQTITDLETGQKYNGRITIIKEH